MLFTGIAGINHIIALFYLPKQLVHLIGGRLSVVIQTDHDLPAGMCKSRHQGRVLPEISGQINAAYVRPLCAKPANHFERIVR